MYNGTKLKELISSKRLIYDELAEMTGLSKTTVYLVVNGKQEMKISVLEKISAALDVPITYFFGDEDNKEKLEKLIEVLNEKIAFLEIQVAQYQSELEIADMRLKSVINIGEEYTKGNPVKFEEKLLELDSIRAKVETVNPNPKKSLSERLANLSQRISDYTNLLIEESDPSNMKSSEPSTKMGRYLKKLSDTDERISAEIKEQKRMIKEYKKESKGKS